MSVREDASALRAARTARGWSQSRAAAELLALARVRGTPVASAASLKTLLSRWENGHSVPDPQYRSLFVDLYGRSPVELGLDRPPDPAAATGRELAEALAQARAAHERGIDLWRRQLGLARELDDELGVAGAGELVSAQLDQLTDRLLHTVDRAARKELAAVLADVAALAGDQALDRVRPDLAWRCYDRSRQAALQAELPEAAAVALAGQVATLIDIDAAATAIELLDEAASDPTPVRWQLAMALARAAAGEPEQSHAAVAAAAQRVERTRVDRVDRRDVPPVELGELHRCQGRVLVTLTDPAAVEPLEQALATAPRSTRHRAAVHADLALALHDHRPGEAAHHATMARRLAAGIGSERIRARLAVLGSPDGRATR